MSVLSGVRYGNPANLHALEIKPTLSKPNISNLTQL